jgi:RNA polymerase subunit RPABC4/transcription elongation factor Spt4
MNILEKQRDILFDACKKIATDTKCPKWIADFLREEVMKAKQVKDDFPDLKDCQETPQTDAPFEVNDIVVVTNNGTSCVAKLVKEAIPVDDIRLFDIQIVEGDKNNQVGQIYYNIPETLMKRK